ncbi:MAG: U32 family peptidase [Clostridia bacterium]|nr:U32 family peptidase [Clostridia bacterium]
MMNHKLEILSPAGSFETLKAAVDSGADAVYFGGRLFSARKNAVNLSDEEIKEAVKYAHLRGAKLYVAVNTLIFDNELEDSFNFIKFCYESGVDAVIVQDLGVLRIIKKYFPDFPVHASTQMTIHNLSGVLQAQKMGFSRVVLSRELSFEDIKYIAQNSDIELEVFVHGALCMSYSGQCLFSSFLGGRSGNRGSCAQPCRLPYTLYTDDGTKISQSNKYLLSLKDLCLIDYISELKKVGVTSLKIEGRMKSSAYVSAVTGIYNKYRDGGSVLPEDKLLLENIFSRDGFTDGHFKTNQGRNMLSYEKNHDDIYSTATKGVVDEAKSLANLSRKTKIDARFVMKNNSPVYFEAIYMGKAYSATGSVNAVSASNMPVDAQRVRAQLEKLGSTVLEFSSLDIQVEDGLYIPIKEINSVRRIVCEQIENLITGTERTYTGEDFSFPKSFVKNYTEVEYVASVLNEAQADICYELGFSKIYIPYSLYKSSKKKFDSDPDIYSVKLPPVNHDSKGLDFSDISVDSVCITNLGQLNILPDNIVKYGDYRLNVCNTFSLNQLMALGVKSVCLSPEMTIAQLSKLGSTISKEVLVYGKVSLMTLKNCVVKSSLQKCGCKNGSLYYLKDRKNISFPVECQKGECVNVIYNSAPVYMADRMKELSKINASAYRFDFVDETPGQICQIIKNYEIGKKSNEFFTRGHFYNGIL